MGRDAFLCLTDSGRRSLEDHRLHSRVAVEPDAGPGAGQSSAGSKTRRTEALRRRARCGKQQAEGKSDQVAFKCVRLFPSLWKGLGEGAEHRAQALSPAPLPKGEGENQRVCGIRRVADRMFALHLDDSSWIYT